MTEEDPSNPPMLLQFLAGEEARLAWRLASPRVRLWCALFDDWLEERRRANRAGSETDRYAWKRLVRQQQKLPFELTTADIRAHVEWLQEQRYTAATIKLEIGRISSFYRWCEKRRAGQGRAAGGTGYRDDPETERGFNPAADVTRPRTRAYASTPLLSRAEVGRLLELMGRDETPLGRRDYAFFLARLTMGVELRALQRLQWGLIEAGGMQIRFDGRAGQPPLYAALPEECWAAIRAYLEASGRLERIQAGDSIFAPLHQNHSEACNRAEDWIPNRSLRDTSILHNLRVYGRAAGLPEEKLVLRALRLTAIRLRLEAGATPEEMEAFLASRSGRSVVCARLSSLPPLPADEPGEGDDEPGEVPGRQPHRVTGKENFSHGLYSKNLPEAEVEAIVAEEIRGLGEEIAGLRALEQGLLGLLDEARGVELFGKLSSAYTLAASRLASLVQAEELLARQGATENWAEEFLADLEQVGARMGMGAFADQARAAALEAGPDDLGLSGRELQREAAGVRLVMRQTIQRAEAALAQRQVRDYLQLVEVHGQACNRLLRVLRAAHAQDRLGAFLMKQIETALEEVTAEMGLQPG